jgi:hypothetical protein
MYFFTSCEIQRRQPLVHSNPDVAKTEMQAHTSGRTYADEGKAAQSGQACE